jgi:hypothetical protein
MKKREKCLDPKCCRSPFCRACHDAFWGIFRNIWCVCTLSSLLRLCSEFAPASRENRRRPKVDASDTVFLKLWSRLFLRNLVHFSALRTVPRNCVPSERAPPLKNRSSGLGFPQIRVSTAIAPLRPMPCWPDYSCIYWLPISDALLLLWRRACRF